MIKTRKHESETGKLGMTFWWQGTTRHVVMTTTNTCVLKSPTPKRHLQQCHHDGHTGQPVLQADNLTSTYVPFLVWDLVKPLATNISISWLFFSFLHSPLVLVWIIIPELSWSVRSYPVNKSLFARLLLPPTGTCQSVHYTVHNACEPHYPESVHGEHFSKETISAILALSPNSFSSC